MDKNQIVPASERKLTSKEFYQLSDVPPEVEWFANIRNPGTQRVYKNAIKEFMAFVDIEQPEEFRIITRAHVIAWRNSLEAFEQSPPTIRTKLSALSSLFDYLCNENAVSHNPVDGVARPKEGTNEGKTPPISDEQARILLDSPPSDTLKGKRDRAILSVLLYHAPRRSEVAGLKVKHFGLRRGIHTFEFHGKGQKIRYVPIHPATVGAIQDYLDECGHGDDPESSLFKPVKNNRGGGLDKHLTSNAIYNNIVLYYSKKTGIYFNGLRPHSLRATGATNALENKADIKRVQNWLGHASVATTMLYDKREDKPEESPTFRVTY